MKEYYKIAAIALVEKFDSAISPTSFSKYKAKNCALIAVEEIMNTLIPALSISNASADTFETTLTYWASVREEINNL